MHKANVAIYFFINCIWAVSIIFWALSYIFNFNFNFTQSLHLLFSFMFILLIPIIQLIGAYKLWNSSYDIPILATSMLLFQLDITGFEFIPQTITNLFVKYEPYKLIIDGHLIDDPTMVINLSFSSFQFQSIAINLVVLMQLALLISFDLKTTNNVTGK